MRTLSDILPDIFKQTWSDHAGRADRLALKCKESASNKTITIQINEKLKNTVGFNQSATRLCSFIPMSQSPLKYGHKKKKNPAVPIYLKYNQMSC